MKRKILTAVILTVALFTLAFTSKAETVTIWGSSSITSITFYPSGGGDPIVETISGGYVDIPSGIYTVVVQFANDGSIPNGAHMQHTYSSLMYNDPVTGQPVYQNFTDYAYPDPDTNSPTFGQAIFYWCQTGENNNNVFSFFPY